MTEKMPANDEIRILRDVYRLGTMGLDYTEEEGWERPLVDKLVRQGKLKLSAAGKLLGERAFRLTDEGVPVAKECYVMFENELGDFMESFEEGLRALLSVGTQSIFGEAR